MEKSMVDQPWNDLPYRNENTALYAYNRLMCLDKNGDPMIDPISEKPTQWAYSGDPVSGNGWLEDIMPRDRRMMLSTGPITVMPGDTNAICLAIMGANNNVRLENITDVKRTAQHLKKYFPDLNLIDVAAEVDIVRFTNTQVELNLKAIFKADAEIASVVAQLYNYDNEFIASTALFDDGANADSISGDNIFSKNVLIDLTDDALYLNLTVDYFGGESATIQCAAENITLTNKIHIDASITADSRNYDGEANPGENIRLKFRVINGYDFTINSFSLTAESKDSLVSFADYSPTIFLRDSIPQQSEIELIDELSLNIDESYPPGNVIQIKLSYADSAHHSWLNYIELPVNEFAYVPNEQMAAHVTGRSDAWFKIMVIVPTDLTGHSYAITINDTLPELKFNLIDETIDSTLIINSALPQQYAYNIPITDGFKVVDAYAPNGGLRDAWYEDVPGGFPRGFVGIRGGGDHVYPGLVEGLAHERDFYAIELEFTNRIDNNGIVGEPAGQLAYCYSMTAGTIPLAVLHNPFNVWKIVFGERAGKLNACYYESIPGNDPLWAPDASVVGGMQKLFIMKSDYDPSGNLYLNTSLNMYDVLYKIFFRLESDSSVVDAGDQFVIDWVCPLSRYDKFTFIPTNVHEKENIKPESFALFQNYPNPFNHHTKIRFFLDKSTKVSFKIFNIMGQQVFSLNEKKFDSGFHELVWNGNDQSGNRVASGIYCYQVSSGKIKITKKMVLIY
ncbi:hypothetical protein B6I21_01980 [candidate division KSB1 bacterium 4572_119]|nr:MAG: hypothetical protein B6I21_01980 [candidate division KSB1 bacterium 4572_119]